MEQGKIEQLAFMQALQKAIGEHISTTTKGNLRAEVDAYYKELYEDTGSKTFDVTINGEAVGTYSIRFSKPKPAETAQKFYVADVSVFAQWFEENVTPEQCQEYASLHLAGFAEWYFFETGETPDGCVLLSYTVPEEEKEYRGGSLRVDPEKVAEAVKTSLPERVTHLLGGGLDG